MIIFVKRKYHNLDTQCQSSSSAAAHLCRNDLARFTHETRNLAFPWRQRLYKIITRDKNILYERTLLFTGLQMMLLIYIHYMSLCIYDSPFY